MNIVIFGATGPLGRRITQAALAAGHQVTAFVRTTGQLDPLPGLRDVTGDVLDPGSVAAAIPGHDAVIGALGHSSPSAAGPISRADVAQFVIHELEHGDHLLTAPTLTAT